MTSTLAVPAAVEPDFTDPAVQAHYIEQAAAHLAAYGKHCGDWWAETDDQTTIDGERAGSPAYLGSSSCCTVGAIAVSLGYLFNDEVHNIVCGLSDYNEDRDDPHPVLATVMAALDCPRVEDVFDWSDNATEAQVINRLGEIAAELRAQASIPAVA